MSGGYFWWIKEKEQDGQKVLFEVLYKFLQFYNIWLIEEQGILERKEKEKILLSLNKVK